MAGGVHSLKVHRAQIVALGTHGEDPALWVAATRLRAALSDGTPLSDLGFDELVRGAFHHVLIRHLAGQSTRRDYGALDRRRLERVCAFIDARLEDELSINKLADVAALSPYHFLRSFKRAIGETPASFVRARRLERAEALLRAGRPIDSVASRLGFKRRDRFAAALRARFGH
ncbi:MAG: AraC family transcriptional regulator [Pseudomonadota bacterium]|nr:AraC family transcriptional regulator [Pseudomonadota bacterium]